MTSKADVLCLQETRLTARQRAITVLAKKKNGMASALGCTASPQWGRYVGHRAWNTWTWVAEEFLLLELNKDGTMESVLQQKWLGPPVLKRTAQKLGKMGWGHVEHGNHHQTRPQQKDAQWDLKN